jgi:hypothetical protein
MPGGRRGVLSKAVSPDKSGLPMHFKSRPRFLAGCKLHRAHWILQGLGELKLVQTQLMLVLPHRNLVKTTAKLLFPAIAFFVFLNASSVCAQDDVLRTETSLVQLNVGVVDRQGQAVITLSQNDFVVYEDNVRRPDRCVRADAGAFQPCHAVGHVRVDSEFSATDPASRPQISGCAWS